MCAAVFEHAVTDHGPHKALPTPSDHDETEALSCLRGRVWFDEAANEYYDSPVYDNSLNEEDDDASSWIPASELQRYHARHTRMAKSVQLVDHAYVTELGNYDHFRSTLVSSLEAIHVQLQPQLKQRQRSTTATTTTTSLVLTKPQRQVWQDSYVQFPERLGLEGAAVVRLKKDKSHRRQALLTCLYDQKRLSLTDDELRVSMERISTPSVVFAHEWAVALHGSEDTASSRTILLKAASKRLWGKTAAVLRLERPKRLQRRSASAA